MKLSALMESWGREQDGGPVAVALHREWHDVEVVAHFTIDGEPQSKSRARISTKNGKVTAYTPRQTQLAEEMVAWRFRQGGGRGPDDSKTFGVFAAFLCGTRQRRDVDNMLKLILDGLNKVAWKDDSQVTEVSGRLVRGVGADHARTEIIVYETVIEAAGGLHASVPCAQCGKPGAPVYNSTRRDRMFCSKECHSASRRVAPTADCISCGKAFKQKRPDRRCCSMVCQTAATTATIACLNCKRLFQTYLGRPRKFCGQECVSAYKVGRPRKGALL